MSLEEDKDEEKKSFIYRMMASLLIKAQSEMLEKELRKKGGMDRSIDRCQEIVRANTIASSILLHFDYSHIDAGVRKQWEKIAVEEVNEKLSTWEKDLASDNVYAERIPEDCNNSTAHLQDTITRLTAELEAANTTIASLTTDKQTLTTKSTRSAAGKSRNKQANQKQPPAKDNNNGKGGGKTKQKAMKKNIVESEQLKTTPNVQLSSVERTSLEDRLFNVKSELTQHTDRFVCNEFEIFQLIGSAIETAFASGRNLNLDIIQGVAKVLIGILSPISKYGAMLADLDLSMADAYSKKIIRFSKATSAASILSRVQKASESADTSQNDVPGDLAKLRLAYIHNQRGDKGISQYHAGELELKVGAPTSKLKEMLQPGWAMTNCLSTVINLFVVDNVCKKMTLAIAFTDLPDSWTVIADAEALFHDIHGLDVSFDTNVLTVRVFIQDTIAPALVEEDHKDLAVKVACQLSLCISPTTKSRQRNGTILPIWRSEQERVPGGDLDVQDRVQDDHTGSQDDHFGDKSKSDQRRRAIIPYFNSLLSDQILEKLVDKYGFQKDLFRSGYISTSIYISPTAMQKDCNFCRKEFFEMKLKIDQKTIEAQVKKINGSKTIVFEHEKQAELMEELLEIIPK